WGFIDKRGKLQVTPQFERVGPFQYERASAWIGGGGSFVDIDGRFILTPDLQWAGDFTSPDLAPVQLASGAFAFVDGSGKVPDHLVGLCEELSRGVSAGFAFGLATCKKDGRWGFVRAD